MFKRRLRLYACGKKHFINQAMAKEDWNGAENIKMRYLNFGKTFSKMKLQCDWTPSVISPNIQFGIEVIINHAI